MLCALGVALAGESTGRSDLVYWENPELENVEELERSTRFPDEDERLLYVSRAFRCTSVDIGADAVESVFSLDSAVERNTGE